MIISDLYKTKIECDTNEASYNSSSTIVTVSLVDFNNQPVTGKNVTLKVDKGYFNKLGTSDISGTTTKEVTTVTDNNGKITATYTASEIGLVTFEANETNYQINVGGLVYYPDSSKFITSVMDTSKTLRFKLYREGKVCILDGYFVLKSLATANNEYQLFSSSNYLPPEVRPTTGIGQILINTSGNRHYLRIYNDGKVTITPYVANTGGTLAFTLSYYCK